ncbi:MAG: hypothetical protein ACYCWW_20660 [Deltaproteobacteria bacterium]
MGIPAPDEQTGLFAVGRAAEHRRVGHPPRVDVTVSEEEAKILTGVPARTTLGLSARRPVGLSARRPVGLSARRPVGLSAPYQVIACIDGRGFGVRQQDCRDLIRATRGKVFTANTLTDLITYSDLADFVP